MRVTTKNNLKLTAIERNALYFSSGVPNLGYMYPWGYICLSEGVHLRLAIEGKIYLHVVYFQIFIHISLNIIFKSQYMYIVKYICEKS